MASQAHLPLELGWGGRAARKSPGKPWSRSKAMFPEHGGEESLWPFMPNFTPSQVWGHHCELSRP